MELKDKLENVVEKVKNDKDFPKKLLDDPVKTMEDVTGIDLPDEQIESAVDNIKKKIFHEGKK